jgi:hypothetical protein
MYFSSYFVKIFSCCWYHVAFYVVEYYVRCLEKRKCNSCLKCCLYIYDSYFLSYIFFRCSPVLEKMCYIYPVPATTFNGVNPPPPSYIGPARTALDVFLLNPQHAYSFGMLAFSIFLSCFSNKNDCVITYSTAGFHTAWYSSLTSDRVHPHFTKASAIVTAFFSVL